jgi:hypothetical protein
MMSRSCTLNFILKKARKNLFCYQVLDNFEKIGAHCNGKAHITTMEQALKGLVRASRFPAGLVNFVFVK